MAYKETDRQMTVRNYITKNIYKERYTNIYTVHITDINISKTHGQAGRETMGPNRKTDHLYI